jgi:hypothetical protein
MVSINCVHLFARVAAQPAPEMSAIVCVDHWSLRDANLQGFDVEMRRRPHVNNPLRFDVSGRQGAFLEQAVDLQLLSGGKEGTS